MAQPPLKRPRVTQDILSFSGLNNIDIKDTTKDKVVKISTQIERLEAENYKLLKQMEWSNHAHELTVKENVRHISALVSEKNDIKARTIHHKARADEAVETLQVMKAKHIEVTNELREKVANMDRKNLELSSELREKISCIEQQKQQVNHLEESHQIKVAQLEKTIELLTQANSDQLKTIETISQRELEHVNRISTLEQTSTHQEVDTESYDILSDQYHRLCKRTEKLESDNSKLSSELKHYKGISQNVEYLREERNSLREQLTTLEKIKNEKFTLQVENANLLSERNAWTRYLEFKPEYNQQSPASIINSLSKQASESKYLSRQVEQLQTELENQYKLISSLEIHVDELKHLVLENEKMKALSEAERKLFDKREATLKKHITILQGQLQLYDEEEKNNMESNYDHKKSLRIAQLELLLRDIENQLKTQATEVKKSILESLPTIVKSHGPYGELSSGKKIIELLQELTQQKEQYIEELKLQKSKQAEQAIPQPVEQQHRILSLVENPATTTQAIRRELLNRLQKENEDLLKRQLNMNDVSVDTVTMPSISYTNTQKQITSLEKRITRLQTIFENKIKEFRGQMSDFLGYQVIFRLDGIVRFESIFVDGNELAFLVKDEDEECILRIVGSNKEKYMDLLSDIYQTYIITERRVSAFLNAASLELYVQSKQFSDDILASGEDDEHDSIMSYEGDDHEEEEEEQEEQEEQEEEEQEEQEEEEKEEEEEQEKEEEETIAYQNQEDPSESASSIVYQNQEDLLESDTSVVYQEEEEEEVDSEQDDEDLLDIQYSDDEEFEDDIEEEDEDKSNEILLLDSDSD